MKITKTPKLSLLRYLKYDRQIDKCWFYLQQNNFSPTFICNELNIRFSYLGYKFELY